MHDSAWNPRGPRTAPKRGASYVKTILYIKKFFVGINGAEDAATHKSAVPPCSPAINSLCYSPNATSRASAERRPNSLRWPRAQPQISFCPPRRSSTPAARGEQSCLGARSRSRCHRRAASTSTFRPRYASRARWPPRSRATHGGAQREPRSIRLTQALAPRRTTAAAGKAMRLKQRGARRPRGRSVAVTAASQRATPRRICSTT